jgi:hypothetical protein
LLGDAGVRIPRPRKRILVCASLLVGPSALRSALLNCIFAGKGRLRRRSIKCLLGRRPDVTPSTSRGPVMGAPEYVNAQDSSNKNTHENRVISSCGFLGLASESARLDREEHGNNPRMNADEGFLASRSQTPTFRWPSSFSCPFGCCGHPVFPLAALPFGLDVARLDRGLNTGISTDEHG